MVIHVFCNSCKPEIVFVLICSLTCQSIMSCIGNFEENIDPSHIYLAVFTLVFRSLPLIFRFLVTFGDELTKIRKYYAIFVYIMQGKIGKMEKNGKKITQQKWPKYQKYWNKTFTCFTCIGYWIFLPLFFWNLVQVHFCLSFEFVQKFPWGYRLGQSSLYVVQRLPMKKWESDQHK